jgi:membrane-bound ClpP family serine protease
MSVLFWPSIFLALGLLLLILEVFLPSGGFIGLCSLLCLILCLWYAFQESVALGAMFMLVDLVVLPLTFSLAFTLWSKTPMGRRFFLKPPEPEEIEVSHSDRHLQTLVGQVGRALTPLRPSGHVEMEGRRVDALAEEGLVPEGAAVQAVRVRSGQLVVRAVREPAAPSREEPMTFNDRAGNESALPQSSIESVAIFEDTP